VSAQFLTNKRQLSPAHVARLRALFVGSRSAASLGRLLGMAPESVNGALTGGLFIPRAAERMERSIDDASGVKRVEEVQET
jgi:hypothetical protein